MWWQKWRPVTSSRLRLTLPSGLQSMFLPHSCLSYLDFCTGRSTLGLLMEGSILAPELGAEARRSLPHCSRVVLFDDRGGLLYSSCTVRPWLPPTAVAASLGVRRESLCTMAGEEAGLVPSRRSRQCLAVLHHPTPPSSTLAPRRCYRGSCSSWLAALRTAMRRCSRGCG